MTSNILYVLHKIYQNLKIKNNCFIGNTSKMRISYKGEFINVRKLLYEITHEIKLKPNYDLVNTCGNWKCYNPEHFVYKLKDKFWSHVDIKLKNECWNWKKSLDINGYGKFGAYKKAHRVAYKLTYGKIPKGKIVMHKCDNPACCNPHHLRLGTQQDNVTDMINKNRQCKGENVQNSKLTKIKVDRIRKMYKSGKYSQQEIGTKFGITQSHIGRIIRHVRWR